LELSLKTTRKNYEKIKCHIKSALSGKSGRAEFSCVAQKNVVKFYEINYVPEMDTKGNVGGFYLLTIDLTERKEAEKEISSLRNYLSNIIDSMPSILIGVDKKNRITQWNLKASEKTGIPPEAAKGRLLATVFPQFTIELAHEINNPLSGMMQSANVMRNRLENIDMPANLKVAEELGISMEDIKVFMEKREIFRMLDAIHESGSRAAEIVSNMLSFARKSDASIRINLWMKALSWRSRIMTLKNNMILNPLT